MKKLAIVAMVLAIVQLGWGQATSDSFSRIHLTPVTAEPISMSVDDVLSLKSLSDEQLTTLVNALNVTPTLPMTALPHSGMIGNFWSLQHPEWPPLPFDSSGVNAWPLTDGTGYLLNDVNFDYTGTMVSSAGGGMHAMAMDVASPPGFGFDGSPDISTNSYFAYAFDTNQLWLELTNATASVACLNLHNATNQVYAIWSTTNLLTSWQVETELWPTATNVIPFTVATFDRQNLFLRAEDWTDVDSDGDGIPDWWIWQYFRNLNENATNVDASGNTFGYDYTNGLNPNLIQFSLVVTNSHVSTTAAPMQISVTAGVPTGMAILMDDTNFSGATWSAYSSSNVLVSLGSTDGDHMVWLGLRGPVTNAPRLWQGVTFTLDRVAPTIVITNPALTTVARPMIQLQGYVSEPLASLTYDLTNATGLVTNQSVYITGQFIDTNSWKFTTNYFQAYDVALTNGANLLTLHAIDLAGNTATLATTLTLDYSGATNPPAITVTWPTNNSLVAGTGFTLQGVLDDDTATVTVSGTGLTNLTGLVERGGRFTVPNLMLPSATNVLTIAATNAAGQGQAISLTVLQSAVVVTMDGIPATELAQEFVTVTGTIGDTNHDVYVNGVLATVSGDPTWAADGVPVTSESGSGRFDIEVYPTGSDPDTTPPTASLKTMATLPPVVQASSYAAKVSFNEAIVTCGGSAGQTAIQQYAQWQGGVGGNSVTTEGFSTVGGGAYSETWPDYWPEDLTWENVSSAITGPSTVDVPCGTGQRTITQQVGTAIELVAGGPAQAGVSQLVHLVVTAAGYSDDLMNEHNGNFYANPGYESPGDVPVPASQIQMLDQPVAATATNAYAGELYVAMPTGAAQNLPVKVTGTNSSAYSFNVQPEPGLIIADASTGTNLTAQTNTVIVGQPMNLSCQTVTANGPTLNNFQWSVPGYAISNYVANSSSGIVYTNFATNNAAVNFYWVDGASNRTVQCSAIVQGKLVTASATFNVLRPTATVTAKTTSVNVYGDTLEFLDTTKPNGITFSNTITIPAGFSGSNLWIQVCYYRVRQLQDTNLIWHRETENGPSPYGDTPIPYGAFNGTNPVDSPNQPMPSSGYVRCDVTNTFEMWMMFKPNGGISVPLRAVNWSWSGSATNVPFGDTMVIWGLVHGTNTVNPADFDTLNYPLWNSDIRNRQWIPTGDGLY